MFLICFSYENDKIIFGCLGNFTIGILWTFAFYLLPKGKKLYIFC